jgi:nucleotide-binding universal stress UspA family protein
MGWKGHSNTRDRIFGEIADRVIRHAPCDILLLKIGETAKMENCLFPTAGGPNAKLASTVLNALAKETDFAVTAGYVLPESALKRHEKEGMRRMEETLADLEKTISCKRELIKSKTVAGGIASASRSFDLVVIGAAKEPFFRKMLFGEIPEKVARYSPTSVLLVKRYEGVVKSLLKKIMG